MKKVILGWLVVCLLAFGFLGCNTQSDVQLPPALQPPALVPPAAPVAPVQPVPAAPPVAVPAPPPATPLTPVVTEVAKAGGGGGSVDRALPGKETSGDELVGNYSCKLETNDLPMGFNPPASGCRIYKAGDGSLRIGPQSRGIGLRGKVTDTKSSGFFIVGGYDLPGNKISIKARMKRKGANNFVGRGRGVLNGNKAKQIKYKLSLTKK